MSSWTKELNKNWPNVNLAEVNFRTNILYRAWDVTQRSLGAYSDIEVSDNANQQPEVNNSRPTYEQPKPALAPNVVQQPEANSYASFAPQGAIQPVTSISSNLGQIRVEVANALAAQAPEYVDASQIRGDE